MYVMVIAVVVLAVVLVQKDTVPGSKGKPILSRPKRIAIIGAGTAGLTDLKSLKNAGFEDITVFEKSSFIGGTWNPEKGYPGLTAQSSTPTIEFVDHQFDSSVSFEFPTRDDMHKYLKDYAKKYDCIATHPTEYDCIEHDSCHLRR